MRWCKPCRARWDAAHYPQVRERRLAHQRARAAETSAVVRELKNRPCADCGGIFHPAAMAFDHLPGSIKRDDISNLARRYSVGRVRDELTKCELVCANCHAVRTFERREARKRAA